MAEPEKCSHVCCARVHVATPRILISVQPPAIALYCPRLPQPADKQGQSSWWPGLPGKTSSDLQAGGYKPSHVWVMWEHKQRCRALWPLGGRRNVVNHTAGSTSCRGGWVGCKQGCR